jgi:hypothetical protein
MDWKRSFVTQCIHQISDNINKYSDLLRNATDRVSISWVMFLLFGRPAKTQTEEIMIALPPSPHPKILSPRIVCMKVATASAAAIFLLFLFLLLTSCAGFRLPPEESTDNRPRIPGEGDIGE